MRGGAILPLHGGGDVQRAAELGGRLEVQVYSGADGEFVLSEDDGESLDYQVSSCGSRIYYLPPKGGFNWRGPARG